MTEVLTCTSKKLCEEGKDDKEKEIGERRPIHVACNGKGRIGLVRYHPTLTETRCQITSFKWDPASR